MTISETEWKNFFDKMVSPNSFQIFARLTNLKNNDNYKEILELLYYNHLNLNDLANEPLLDDLAVDTILKNRKSLITPTVTSSTENGFTAQPYLLGSSESPTALGLLVKEFNIFLSDSVLKDEDLTGEIFPPIYTEFGLEKGSAYSNYSDYLTDFDAKVLTPLLAEYGVAEISSIFPPLAIEKTLDVAELEYITTTYDKLFATIKASFTNNKLAELLVWTVEKPSVFSSEIKLFNDLLNMRKYTKVIEMQLFNKIFWLSERGNGTFTESDIASLKAEILSFDIRNLPLSDSLCYVIFQWTMINTIEQNSNLPVSENFLYEYKKFYALIETFKNIYLKLADLISRKLHVKVD